MILDILKMSINKVKEDALNCLAQKMEKILKDFPFGLTQERLIKHFFKEFGFILKNLKTKEIKDLFFIQLIEKEEGGGVKNLYFPKFLKDKILEPIEILRRIWRDIKMIVNLQGGVNNTMMIRETLKIFEDVNGSPIPIDYKDWGFLSQISFFQFMAKKFPSQTYVVNDLRIYDLDKMEDNLEDSEPEIEIKKIDPNNPEHVNYLKRYQICHQPRKDLKPRGYLFPEDTYGFEKKITSWGDITIHKNEYFMVSSTIKTFDKFHLQKWQKFNENVEFFKMLRELMKVCLKKRYPVNPMTLKPGIYLAVQDERRANDYSRARVISANHQRNKFKAELVDYGTIVKVDLETAVYLPKTFYEMEEQRITVTMNYPGERQIKFQDLKAQKYLGKELEETTKEKILKTKFLSMDKDRVWRVLLSVYNYNTKIETEDKALIRNLFNHFYQATNRRLNFLRNESESD